MNTPIETARGKLSRLSTSVSARRWLLATVATLLVAVGVVVGAGVVAATRTEVAVAEAPALLTGADLVSAGEATTFWTSPSVPAVRLADTEGVDGASAVGVTVAAKRRFFTIVEHDFPKAQDWSKRPWLFLEFRGTASGSVYSISLALAGDRSLSYDFVDTSAGWSVLAFDLLDPDEGEAPGGSRVTSVKIASASKNAAASFALGRLSLSAQPG